MSRIRTSYINDDRFPDHPVAIETIDPGLLDRYNMWVSNRSRFEQFLVYSAVKWTMATLLFSLLLRVFNNILPQVCQR